MIASHWLTALAGLVTSAFLARYVVPALEAWRHWIAARRDRLNIIARVQARDLRNYKRHGTL